MPLALPLSYPVYCRAGVLQEINRIVANAAPAHRYAIIADATVATLYSAAVLSTFADGAARVFTVAPGEQEKSRERWASLTDELFAWGAGRDTTVIAIGGGVVCDLAGFVAATFMRGVPIIQVPTTLLAMVDASVGGKTAVDVAYGKNLVGAFHDPSAVIMDPEVLASLPAEQWRSGLAEMIKHGVIADASYFDAMLRALPEVLRSRVASDEFATLIAGSVRIKADVVAQDAREGGLRQILNFGHTIGHAVERELDYQILHGEAVAIGMVVESAIAEQLGLASPGLTDAVTAAARSAGLPTRVPASISAHALVASTQSDKKTRAGTVRYALPRSIGDMEPADGRWSVPVADDLVMSVLSRQ